MYLEYISLKKGSKSRLRKRIKDIIVKELLGKEFYKAIAQDIIDNDTIQFQSHLYKYLVKYYYHGDSRRLLIDLMDILKDE